MGIHRSQRKIIVVSFVCLMIVMTVTNMFSGSKISSIATEECNI